MLSVSKQLIRRISKITENKNNLKITMVQNSRHNIVDLNRNIFILYFVIDKWIKLRTGYKDKTNIEKSKKRMQYISQ